MFRRIGAFIFLLLAWTPAVAASWSASSAHWVKLRTKGDSTYYVDARSIIARGAVREVWEKTVIEASDPRRVTLEIAHWRYDCARRRSVLVYNSSYLKDGALVDSAGVPPSQRTWDDVLPNSVAGAALRFVCSHR